MKRELLRALFVGALGSVDDDALAVFDEEGNANFGAALNRGRLKGVGGGVAAHSGLGVGYLERDGGRKLHTQGAVLVGVEHHHALHAVLKELRGVDHLLGHGDLLVGVHVHKVVSVGVVVEVLVGAELNFDVVQLGSAGEGVLKDAAVVEVAHLGPHERGALAGLHVKEFDDLVRRMIEVDAHAVLDVCGSRHIAKILAKVRNRPVA